MALYLTVLISVLNQIGLKGSKMLIALHALELKADPVAIGVLIATYAVFPLMLAVYAGRLTDRIGVRWPMLCGSLGMTAGLLVPVAWPTIAALFAAAAMLGTANIFFHVSCHNLVGSIDGAGSRTSNFGTFSLGGSVSGMLGPVLVGFMVDRAGYSWTFVTLASIVTLPGFVLLLYPRFIPAKVESRRDPEAGGVRELLADRALRNTLITSGLIITALDLFNFYMPIYGRSLGLQATAIGWIIGMQAAAAFVVRLWMPRLAQRYGEARVLTWSLLMAGLTYLLFPVFEQPLVMGAVSFLLGLGLGCGQPLSTVLTYNHSPPGRIGEALGMRLAVNKFTQVSVPILFGSLSTAFGIYPVFWSNAVLLLVGGALIARGQERSPARGIDEAGAK
ncbi:MFS transporter [Massilia niastensis]|uniref:MFS transporter n=1 Tax=Massilia niastensis TaxID=544911 RepID=UPI00036D73BC|nr:MFS transporter [Massilia niastensis]